MLFPFSLKLLEVKLFYQYNSFVLSKYVSLTVMYITHKY